ncbi:MAG: hypothetical protein J2P37_05315, partial [Ktedonobacteraceae bacterium]|nr:hypothetical protein [Ktedonobacteraceae bacterium]
MSDVNVGELSRIVLNVRDMNAQVAFYRDVLGLSVKEPQGVNDFRDFYSVEFYTGNCILTLQVGEQTVNGNEVCRLFFRVADIHACRQRLLEYDTVADEVYSPTESILICNCQDPEGNAFSLEQRKDTPFNPVEITETPGTVQVYVWARSRRGRSIRLLRDNKWLMTLEVLFVSALLIIASFSELISFVTPLLVVMALLWLSGNNWSKMGLRKPGSWRRSIQAGAIAGVLLFLFQLCVVAPIGALFHIPSTAQIAAIVGKGNFLAIVSALITVLTTQACAGEMIFRGYLLNRLGDLFERRLGGWTLACFAQALVFGLTRLNGGIMVAVSAFLFGLIFSLLYFLA